LVNFGLLCTTKPPTRVAWPSISPSFGNSTVDNAELFLKCIPSKVYSNSGAEKVVKASFDSKSILVALVKSGTEIDVNPLERLTITSPVTEIKAGNETDVIA
jgi:hypothetical protein